MFRMGFTHEDLQHIGKQAGGPPVCDGKGCYLFPDGSMVVGRELQSPPSDANGNRSARKHYWQVLLDMVQRDLDWLVRSIKGELTQHRYGMTENGFTWPYETNWRFPHYGKPPYTKEDGEWYPDNDGAVKRLTDLKSTVEARVREFERDPRSQQGLGVSSGVGIM